MISEEKAIELFNKFKEMPFSGKSDRHQAGCDLRAHKIVNLLLEHGVEETDIDKAWIYTLPDNRTEDGKNVLMPVNIIYPYDDEFDCDEAGQFRNRDDRLSPKPYNHHVTPVLKTSNGKEFAFDTFFFDSPPTLNEWSEYFNPFIAGTELGFKRTDPSYLYIEDTASPLPKKGSWSRIFYDFRKNSDAENSLRGLKPLNNFERIKPVPIKQDVDNDKVEALMEPN